MRRTWGARGTCVFHRLSKMCIESGSSGQIERAARKTFEPSCCSFEHVPLQHENESACVGPDTELVVLSGRAQVKSALALCDWHHCRQENQPGREWVFQRATRSRGRVSTRTYACLVRGFSSHGGANEHEKKASLSDDDDIWFDDDDLSESFSSDGDVAENGDSQGNLTKGLISFTSKDEQVGTEDDVAELDDDSHTKVDTSLTRSFLDTSGDRSQQVRQEPNDLLWRRIEKSAGRRPYSLRSVLDRWIAEGNPISKAMIVFTVTVLRRRKNYRRALEILDWVITDKPFEVGEWDYTFLVSCMAIVYGVRKAENYFTKIPKKFQGIKSHLALLMAYVENDCEQEAVGLVENLVREGVSVPVGMYNQLLLIHKRKGDKDKVVEVLHMMDQRSVKPDIFTYNILLEIKAKKAHVSGMVRIMNKINEEATVQPNRLTYDILAKGYIKAGLISNAEEAMKQMEILPCRQQAAAYRNLLELYGELHKVDEVERIWRKMKDTPKNFNFYLKVMIKTLGKMGEVERAEELFKKMFQCRGSDRSQQFNLLLGVYTAQGMTQRVQEVMKEMIEESVVPNAETYHRLTQVYVESGQEQEAVQTLAKALKAMCVDPKNRPWYDTFHLVLKMFGDKGDVPMAEKTFSDIKKAGYTRSFRSYNVLLNTYVKAGVTPYGFLDRMKVDRAIPNAQLRSVLKRLNGN